MTRVLVTGFEPFGSASRNPSQEIVSSLGTVPGIELHRLVLPVVFDSAAKIALDVVDQIQPDVVVSLGQAEGRTEISVEQVAVNLIDARIPDNAGVQITHQAIDLNGPAAYFTSLPAREMVAAMRSVGIPSGISLSAGAFLCNHLFYSLLHALRSTGLRSGFIHVPLMTEQSEEFPGLFTMPLTDMTRAIESALSVLSDEPLPREVS
jgi:pyroglutamyl-peptidase